VKRSSTATVYPERMAADSEWRLVEKAQEEIDRMLAGRKS